MRVHKEVVAGVVGGQKIECVGRYWHEISLLKGHL